MGLIRRLFKTILGNSNDNDQGKAECEICFQYKRVVDNNIYNNKSTNCTIRHPYCQSCIKQHILHKINTKNNANVVCPSPGCMETLDPVACSAFLSRPVFVSWIDLLAESYITQRGFQRSVCPYNDCSEVVVDECRLWRIKALGGGKEVCPHCSREFCFICGAKWRPRHGLSCGDSDKRFKEDAESWGWGRCPNCRFFVERNGGCNQIHCRCGTRFTYRSLGGSDALCVIVGISLLIFVIISLIWLMVIGVRALF